MDFVFHLVTNFIHSLMWSDATIKHDVAPLAD